MNAITSSSSAVRGAMRNNRAAGQAVLPGPAQQPGLSDFSLTCDQWSALTRADRLARVTRYYSDKDVTVSNTDISNVVQNITNACLTAAVCATPPLPWTSEQQRTDWIAANPQCPTPPSFVGSKQATLPTIGMVPNPVSPPDAGTVHSAAIRFTGALPPKPDGTLFPNAIAFEVRICTDSAMQQACINTATGSPSVLTSGGQGFQIPVFLSPGRYFWAARAENAAGAWGDYGPTHSLTVDAAVVAPAPGDTTRGRQYFQGCCSGTGITCAVWSGWSHSNKAHAMDSFAPGAGTRAADPSEPGYEDARVEQAIADVDAYCRAVAPVVPVATTTGSSMTPVLVGGGVLLALGLGYWWFNK